MGCALASAQVLPNGAPLVDPLHDFPIVAQRHKLLQGMIDNLEHRPHMCLEVLQSADAFPDLVSQKQELKFQGALQFGGKLGQFLACAALHMLDITTSECGMARSLTKVDKDRSRLLIDGMTLHALVFLLTAHAQVISSLHRSDGNPFVRFGAAGYHQMHITGPDYSQHADYLKRREHYIAAFRYLALNFPAIARGMSVLVRLYDTMSMLDAMIAPVAQGGQPRFAFVADAYGRLLRECRLDHLNQDVTKSGGATDLLGQCIVNDRMDVVQVLVEQVPGVQANLTRPFNNYLQLAARHGRSRDYVRYLIEQRQNIFAISKDEPALGCYVAAQYLNIDQLHYYICGLDLTYRQILAYYKRSDPALKPGGIQLHALLKVLTPERYEFDHPDNAGSRSAAQDSKIQAERVLIDELLSKIVHDPLTSTADIIKASQTAAQNESFALSSTILKLLRESRKPGDAPGTKALDETKASCWFVQLQPSAPSAPDAGQMLDENKQVPAIIQVAAGADQKRDESKTDINAINAKKKDEEDGSISVNNPSGIKVDQEAASEDSECLLCKSNRRIVLSVDCAHAIICLSCVGQFVSKGSKKCPLCQVPVSKLLVGALGS